MNEFFELLWRLAAFHAVVAFFIALIVGGIKPGKSTARPCWLWFGLCVVIGFFASIVAIATR